MARKHQPAGALAAATSKSAAKKAAREAAKAERVKTKATKLAHKVAERAAAKAAKAAAAAEAARERASAADKGELVEAAAPKKKRRAKQGAKAAKEIRDQTKAKTTEGLKPVFKYASVRAAARRMVEELDAEEQIFPAGSPPVHFSRSAVEKLSQMLEADQILFYNFARLIGEAANAHCCQQDGCHKLASFRTKDVASAQRCDAHKTEDMVPAAVEQESTLTAKNYNIAANAYMTRGEVPSAAWMCTFDQRAAGPPKTRKPPAPRSAEPPAKRAKKTAAA